MKKILPALVLLSILVAVSLPMVAAADGPPTTCKITKTDIKLPDGTTCPTGNVSIENFGACCVLNVLYNITDWIFVFLLALATIFVIIGAFYLLTAAGRPETINLGRNFIIYAAVGLAVAFLAKAIPGIVKLVISG